MKGIVTGVPRSGGVLSESQLLERARQEQRVMTEMERMAMANGPYVDVVQAVLGFIEQLVSCPLLFLSMREWSGLGHYARAADGLHAAWQNDAGRAIADLHEGLLTGSGTTAHSGDIHYTPGPPAWCATFLARTRSGWGCALTLGAPQALDLTREEEQLMLRLASQALLVLDRALLLAQVDDLETTDRLTGVANHRRFHDLLQYEMQRHRYGNKRLALVVLDIEGLDGINRSYGRQYGNHILKRLAEIVRESVRPIDIVARCGLDEFAVILPETDGENAQGLAEQLKERVLDVSFAGGEVGVSVGVAHMKPEEMLTPEDFLRRSEGALTETKRQQRNWQGLSGVQRIRTR